METLPVIDNNVIPEISSCLLTSPLSSKFIMKTPKIGINKKLRKITLEKTNINPNSKITNTLSQEQCEQISFKNFLSYKNLTNKVLYILI